MGEAELNYHFTTITIDWFRQGSLTDANSRKVLKKFDEEQLFAGSQGMYPQISCKGKNSNYTVEKLDNT